MSSAPSVVLLVSPLRAGSIALQSYLDNHPDVLMVPNVFFFFNFIEEHWNPTSSAKVIREFIGYPGHQGLFDSKKSYILGRGLGEDQDQFFQLDRDAFARDLTELCTEIEWNVPNFHFAVHKVFHQHIYQKEINEPKVLLHHIHNLEMFPLARKYLSNFKVLSAVRDPFKALESAVRFNLLRYPGKYAFPYNWSLRRYLEGWVFMANNCNRTEVKIFRLEDLKEDRSAVMGDLLKWLSLEYHPEIEKSTLGAELWWGDLFTKKAVNGVSKPEPSDIDGSISADDRELLSLLGIGGDENCRPTRYLFLALSNIIPRKSDWQEVIENLKTIVLGPSTAYLEDFPHLAPHIKKSTRWKAIEDTLALPFRLIDRACIWLSMIKHREALREMPFYRVAKE